jgi:hypothetical protein
MFLRMHGEARKVALHDHPPPGGYHAQLMMQHVYPTTTNSVQMIGRFGGSYLSLTI